MERDPVLENAWHPVAASAAIASGEVRAAALLGRELALWRGADGVLRAWEDRCPHRGTRFSIARVQDSGITCAYHGWSFDGRGQCTRIPALPEFTPPAAAHASTYAARERYGLVWVSIGDPAEEVPPYPEYDDANLRKVVCGPYEVAASGPRIVENFLDMAHFFTVHEGILGDAARPEVRDYKVGRLPEGAPEGKGIIATECFAWQPQTNSLAHGGTEVEYTYRVVAPLTAILTKVPEVQRGFREAISLHVQPLAEEASRAWIVMAMSNFVQPDEELRAFQDRIFLQDKPILENQRPRRLPLAAFGSADGELSVGCDRMSVAYRRYLAESGLRFGVIAAAG